MNKPIDFILVQRLRKAFDLYEGYSAQDVLDITKGTTSRAFIELDRAADLCGIEFRNFARLDWSQTRSRWSRFINWLRGRK